MAIKKEELKAFAAENKGVLLIVALGLMLLLLPAGGGGGAASRAEYSEEEEKLAEVLSEIRGVGECHVLLRRSGKDQMAGALVVCEGAKSAEVCLAVKKAVAAYTGLGSDRIMILQSKQGGKL